MRYGLQVTSGSHRIFGEKMRLAKSFIEVDTDAREPAATTIKAYMPVGSMSGSGSIDVTAFEALIPSKELVFHGVRF